MNKEIQKKIRIQLYDPEFNHFSDRLVEQDTELAKGPAEEHKGPMKIEVSLFDQEDIEKFKKYLDQLIGILPRETKVPGKRGRPKLSTDSMDGSHEELVKTILFEIEKGIIENQEQLIESLRTMDFKFLTLDFIEDLELKFKPEEEHEDSYQWMMPCIKEAKDPANDKYDPKLVFGIRIMGKKIPKFVIYLHGELVENCPISLPWGKENSYNIHKTDMAKFPVYMRLQEERDAFRKAIRDLQRDPEMRVPKIVRRWYQDVEFAYKEEVEKRLAAEQE